MKKKKVFPGIEGIQTGNQRWLDSIDAMQQVLTDIFPGYDWDDSQQHTAERFVKYLREYIPLPAPDFIFTMFPAEVNQLIVVRDMEFSSICKHHLLPFHGIAHLGYIPNELMVGASKIPRLVEFWARRPQTQELLTEAIAADFKHKAAAMGVAVQMKATHTCMACRGVRKVGASMITSELRGVFLTSDSARLEWLHAIA